MTNKPSHLLQVLYRLIYVGFDFLQSNFSFNDDVLLNVLFDIGYHSLLYEKDHLFYYDDCLLLDGAEGLLFHFQCAELIPMIVYNEGLLFDDDSLILSD